MDRESLQKLSVEELFRLGIESGVNVYSLLDKEELIDFLVEQLEWEDQAEIGKDIRKREKYFHIEGNQKAGKLRDDFPVPEYYNDTRIVLLLKDPEWAFAYWDIAIELQEKIISKTESPRLILRVFDLGKEQNSFLDNNLYFDVPVQLTDHSWYINVPNPGSSYRIDLGYFFKERFIKITSSNVVRTPTGMVSEITDENWYSENTEKLIEISGGKVLFRSQRERIIPRRVTSIAASHYFYNQDRVIDEN